MTTLAALVAATPAATRGVPTGFVHGTGEWRHVLEVADPAAGSSVAWRDVTAFMANGGPFTGYEYTRGSDGYQGRYRASVATIDLWTADDSLAPWNPDTSPIFGTHIKLGPGLLIRSGFIRVNGGVVDAWNPRFTNKVNYWGDASYSKGKARQHRIIARDTMTSMVGRPLPATSEENWSDRMFHWLTNSGWPYGSAVYGAQFTAAAAPIKTLAARPAVSSAVNELDTICDPVGLVWYTNRLGQLVVRPTVYDTFHAAAFAAGATGDQWPSDVMPVGFSWAACMGEDGSGNASYAVDHSPASPFGLDESETPVINHVVITTSASGSITAHTFDDDDPVSIQRYDPHDLQASWIAANDTVAADLLAFRANATVEARPLHTTIDLPGFHPGPARAEYLDYITIDHRNSEDGLGAFANGYLRSYREQVAPRGCDTLWQLTLTIDVYNVISDAGLLPVEDLTLVDVTDTTAEFSWTNPAQTVTPTHTQVRMINPASLWLTTDYPITGLEWAGLAPSTGYEFQVRLIRIDDGLITHYSPIRSLEFTTDPAATADVDPADPGSIDVDIPDPTPGCIIGWELQWSTTGTGSWTTIDSGTISTAPFDITDYDGSALNDDYWYRFRWREICGGTPGAWHTDNYFPLGCITVPRFATAPYDDANLVAYWPQICPDHISEAVSDEPMTLGPAITGSGFDATGIPTMLSGPEGVIGYGIQPTTHPTIYGYTDLTLACRARIHTAPAAERTLLEYGGLRISIFPSGAGFKLRGHCNEAAGGDTFVSGATVLALDTVYDFGLVHDVGADNLKLAIAGVDEAHALGSVGARFNFGLYSIQLAAGSWITDCAVWDRALALSELPGYVTPPPSVTINQKVGQSDPTSTGPILYTIVFSEAVTGFATGDVTLSGTAGGTLVGTVTGTGANYEVSVAGMTSAGTVVATIAANKCTSVATSLPNAASTSTDNTVTYNLWTPADIIGAGLRWWYDGVTSPSGSNLTDLSGAGITLAKTGTVTTGGSPLNGHNTLVHAGGRYTAASAATHKFMHDGTSNVCVIAAIKYGTGSNPATFYGGWGNNGTSTTKIGVCAYYDDTPSFNDRHVAQISAGSAGNFVASNSYDNKITANAWHVVAVRYDPSNGTSALKCIGNVDLGADMTNSAGTASPSASNPTHPFQIGDVGNSVGPLTGAIAEIFCFDNATGRIDLAIAYLKNKYAI